MPDLAAIRVAICEALDLNPHDIRRLTLDLKAGNHLPVVTVEYMLHKLDADGELATTLKRYTLVEQDEEDRMDVRMLSDAEPVYIPGRPKEGE